MVFDEFETPTTLQDKQECIRLNDDKISKAASGPIGTRRTLSRASRDKSLLLILSLKEFTEHSCDACI